MGTCTPRSPAGTERQSSAVRGRKGSSIRTRAVAERAIVPNVPIVPGAIVPIAAQGILLGVLGAKGGDDG